MNYETARYHMIEQQLRTAEVLAHDVVAQLYADRREHYVPAAYRTLAFADTAIPLGAEGAAMLTPKLEARLLQVAGLKGGERVLEVGTGSGHFAALLAERAAQVWSIEIDAALAERARSNLSNDGVDNVSVETGDGLAGLPAQAPFDLIVVTGGLHTIPAALLAQLKVGGQLLAFVTLADSAPLLALRRIVRRAEGVDSVEDLMETVVPLLRQPAASRFSF